MFLYNYVEFHFQYSCDRPKYVENSKRAPLQRVFNKIRFYYGIRIPDRMYAYGFRSENLFFRIFKLQSPNDRVRNKI